MTCQTEEWRSVDGWPYEVSNLGNVRRRTATGVGRLLLGAIRTGYGGYRFVSMTDINPTRVRHARVHRLVAFAFLGPPPSEKHEVAHNDGDPLNNHVTNLRWATSAENEADKIRHGRTTLGSRNSQHKLTERDVLAMRRLRAKGIKLRDLAEMHGVTEGTVSRAVRGTRDGWGWFKTNA